MEDRYLFRGKRIDNGEWVYGAVLFHDSDAATIFNQHPADGSLQGFEVDVETICQCTAMPDKNKKLVFEHDIVWDSDGRAFYKIIWNQEDMCWNVGDADGYKCVFEVCYGDTIEVNGNIFDNPELLEV